MRSRVFVYTQFENLERDDSVLIHGKLAFIAYGNEVCPSSGRPHRQGFLWFKQQQDFGAIFKKRWQPVFGNLDIMRGSLQSNHAYCSKANSLIKFGSEPAQGDRNDLKVVCGDILSGKRKLTDILEDDPAFWHMYGRTLTATDDLRMTRTERSEMTLGIWYWGATGVGKSHRAHMHDTAENTYTKCLRDDWWDGYNGHPTVLLEDFRGEIDYAELLRMVDKWPFKVKRRNREPTQFLAKTVIVTSSRTPEQIYKKVMDDGESLGQLYRRFEVVGLTESSQKCSEGNNGDL